MMKKRIVLLLILISGLLINVGVGDVPTVTDLEVGAVTDGINVIMTVRHSGPTSSHYVSQIEVKIGDTVEVFQLEPKDSVEFTETLFLEADDVVEVRAFCTFHGWSAWKPVESSGDEPDGGDSGGSGGIPGFPLAAVGLGLAGLSLLSKRD